MIKSFDEYSEICKNVYYTFKKIYYSTVFDFSPKKATSKICKLIKFPKKGQRFAIKYKDIVGPVAEIYKDLRDSYYHITDITTVHITRVIKDSTKLDSKESFGELSELWTVVEYIGNNQFKDLVTGTILKVPVSSKEVKDTVSKDTEKEAMEIKNSLLEKPLSIKGEIVKIGIEYSEDNGYTDVYDQLLLFDKIFPNVDELSPKIKEQIIQNTLPKKEQLQKIMQDLEVRAREKVSSYYDDLNSKKMEEYYEDAMSKSREMQEKKKE